MIKILQARTATSASGEKVEITQQDLHDIADNYNQEEPSPFVLGHPKDDAPAKGWVESLVVKGNELFAKGKDYTKDLIEKVGSREYTKISSSLHKKDSTANPNPGKLSLKHVGFLGAAAPAMPMGQVDVSDLSADDDAVIYSFSDIEGDDFEFNDEESDMTEAEIKALQDKLEKAEVQNAALQETVSKHEKRAGLRAAKDFSDSVDNFCAGAVKAGQLLPAQKDDLVKLFNFANTAGQTMDFSEDGVEDPTEVLKAFIGGLKQVDFSEQTNEDVKDTVDLSTVVSPDGHNVSKEDAATLVKVQKFQAEHKVDFETAINQLEERGEI